MFTKTPPRFLHRSLAAVMAVLLPFGLSTSIAGTTDIATAPLVTASSASVKPNILYILDDSGSMGWLYMPDEANNFQQDYGYASSQCNGVYYDPTITYSPPIKADGTSYPNATFTSAWLDGFNTGNGTRDLSNNFQVGDGSAAQAAFYYKYSGTQTTAKLKNYFNSSSTFYKECNSGIGSEPGASVFTKVVVDVAEQQNFANWHAYYRSRMAMAKSASGLAFKGIDNRYRVAYMTINNSQGSAWLDHNDFTGAHRTNWYAKLYGAKTGSSTPLRQALSRGGAIYARKITSLYGQAVSDPIQYSCQQNFTILTTDGYWNGSPGFKLSTGALDESVAVGNQDSTEPRPRFDGVTPAKTKVVTTTVKTTRAVTTATKVDTRILKRRATQPTTQTVQWTRNLVSASSSVCNASATAPTNCITIGSGSTRRNWCVNAAPIISLPPHTCVVAAGSNTVFMCRSNNTSNPPGGSACRTDSDGVKWCVYPNNSTTGTSSCTRAGSGINAYVCRAADPRYTITSQPQRYTQTVQRNTVTDTSQESRATSVTTTTNNTINTTVVTTIDGVVISTVSTPSTSQTGPTTTGPTTVTDTAIITSGPTTNLVSDNGAPTMTTTWSNNGSSSSVCAVLPVVPPGVTPGGSAGTVSVAGTPSNSTGTTVNSTLSDVTTPVTTTVVTNPTVADVVSTVTTTIPAIAGSSNSLSDVAQYYYVTDLRSADFGNATGALGSDVTENNVPASGKDSASWQHMTTFTLGIGALGRMVYSPTYETDTSGDYFDVKSGSTANSASGICTWETTGNKCNWPAPAENQPSTIDDLWHAAVNGRGAFFAATNPTSLATAIANALSGVSARTGASAAATTSNPNVTSGDNFVFESTFVTAEWSGQLLRKQLDLETGVVKPTIDWSSQEQLDNNLTRLIYTRDATAMNGLRSFAWSSLTTAEKDNFALANITTLSQFCAVGAECLDATAKADAAGEKLVRYLIGDRTNEGVKEDPTKYYRVRSHVLGDIVNAEAVFVRKSTFNYVDTATETGYAAFKAANDSRVGAVYVAANDGMLHAFDSETGAERWAYAPTFIFPTMYKLADKNYANQHQYFLDGTPRVQDVFDGTSWRTILVAGTNAGGRGYYALDITNPTAPKSLWEFTADNLGLTFGNPEIAKLKNGTWVVMFGSGYNNVAPGDGVGRLFILNAVTGAFIRSISTGVGSTTSPSGLARISAWVDKADVDNTALRVYGGDLQGNLWRFDINNDIGAAGFDAHKLVTLVDGAGVAQPIMGKPELGETASKAVILVGTGQYLGTTDLASTQRQSFYGVKDNLDTVTLSNPRISTSKFVQQVQTAITCPTNAPASLCTAGQIVRTSTNNSVDFTTGNGWYVDLIDSGERVNTDSQLALGTLVFNTNIPNATACTVGGYSNRYFLDFRTGAAVSTASGLVGARLGNALATRPVIVKLPNNTVVALTRLSDGTTVTNQVPIAGSGEPGRRVSWRELVN
jgi:type IV pilus assembly protein PilY1